MSKESTSFVLHSTTMIEFDEKWDEFYRNRRNLFIFIPNRVNIVTKYAEQTNLASRFCDTWHAWRNYANAKCNKTFDRMHAFATSRINIGLLSKSVIRQWEIARMTSQLRMPINC